MTSKTTKGRKHQAKNTVKDDTLFMGSSLVRLSGFRICSACEKDSPLSPLLAKKRAK